MGSLINGQMTRGSFTMGPARKQRGRDLAGASGGGDVSDINKGCGWREGGVVYE